IIQSSTFNNDKSIDGPTILALEVKDLKVLNNKIATKTTKKGMKAIIQIGRDSAEHDPTKVYGATVRGNKIVSNFNRVGIDSINGGIGAPTYIIKDNDLYQATLRLKGNDINSNNQLSEQ
ncbi:hypothetical protein G6549_27425, partial [Bacillus sp. MM2020_1]|nr:hypothetical protein [Bacillus sp. MM2020_1]